MDAPTPLPFDDLRPPNEPGLVYRPASVLILVYPRLGVDHIVFMRRTETVEHHKGQISLPGGAQEPGDADAVQAALREAHEELGIDPGVVDVMDILPRVFARVSSFVITPVVARLKPEAMARDIVFRPEPAEVAEIIEVPLSALRDASIHRTEPRAAGSVVYTVHYYNYGPYEIWGVTGRIIHEFLRRFAS